jgi:hypothetical protein
MIMPKSPKIKLPVSKSNAADKKKEKPTKKVPPRSAPNRRWM